MLLVDSRAGSKDLIVPLRKLDLEVEETMLDFGDICFSGRGVGGRPVSVGIEYKQLQECVQSLRSERLQGHQAPGMQDAYDFRWLLIEGELHFDRSGFLQRRVGRKLFKPMPGRMTVTEYWKRINTLHLCWGLNPFHTTTETQTLKWIETLYRTWTDVDLDKHKSHLGIYQPPTLVPISDERQALCMWPGVGMRVSKAALDYFHCIENAARGTLAEWANLEMVDEKGKSRRFGEKNAQKVRDFLEGQP